MKLFVGFSVMRWMPDKICMSLKARQIFYCIKQENIRTYAYIFYQSRSEWKGVGFSSWHSYLAFFLALIGWFVGWCFDQLIDDELKFVGVAAAETHANRWAPSFNVRAYEQGILPKVGFT